MLSSSLLVLLILLLTLPIGLPSSNHDHPLSRWPRHLSPEHVRKLFCGGRIVGSFVITLADEAGKTER